MPTGASSVVRLVLDTNVVISGLLWRGAPGQLIDEAQNGRITLFSSVDLLLELRGVLSRPKFAHVVERSGVTVEELFEGYASLAELVAPAPIEIPASRDPDDDRVLAAAVVAEADMIVSGDADLVDLGTYCDIRIVTARSALEAIRAIR